MSHYFRNVTWSTEPNISDLINYCQYFERLLPQQTLDEIVKLYLPMQALALKEPEGRARLLTYYTALEEAYCKLSLGSGRE